MKLITSITLTLLTVQIVFGKVAIIQDPDGKSEIIHKIYNNEVFWYEEIEEGQGWVTVYIPKNNYCLGKSEPNHIVGFIHRSLLLPIEKLKQCSSSQFSFQYKLSEFNSTNRIIDKQNEKWIIAIDGQTAWGIDGNYPKIQVNHIEISIEGEKIKIHEIFFSDIYECNDELMLYKNGDIYFAHQWNSDGAGAYEIVWVLDKNGLKQRLVGTI